MFTMAGSLGYIDRSKRKVGLLLTGTEEGDAHQLSRSFCFGSWGEGNELLLQGSVIALVTPVDKVTESIKLTLAEKAGVQAVSALERQEAASLVTLNNQFSPAATEQTGVALTAVLKFPGLMEVSG
jgi:hypothetical protein